MLPFTILTGFSWLSLILIDTVQAIKYHRNLSDKGLIIEKRDGMRTGQIIGGEQASIQNQPWIVSLQKWYIKRGSGKLVVDHHCGGSIIDDQWLLTAGHCSVFLSRDVIIIVDGASDAAVAVVAGATDHDAKVVKNNGPGNTFFTITNPDVEVFTELEWTIHEGFDSTATYAKDDIALIHVLGGSFKFNDRVQKAKLSDEESYVDSFEQCEISGWGMHSEDHLAVLKVELLNKTQCIDKFVEAIRRMLDEPGMVEFFITMNDPFEWEKYFTFTAIPDELKKIQDKYNATHNNEDLLNQFKTEILKSVKQNYPASRTNGRICVWNNDTSKSACPGDSGGPLTCINKHNGKRYLVGETEGATHRPANFNGTACEAKRLHAPFTYTNIAHYRNWICPRVKAACINDKEGKGVGGACEMTSAVSCVWSLVLLSVCLTI